MNKIRGEAGLSAGGKQYRLLLTLGALAEIESGLGLTDLTQIGARLTQVRAHDLAIVVAALLRGGGHAMTAEDVLALPCDLGVLVASVTASIDAAGLGKGGASDSSAPFPGPPGSNSA